MTKCPRCNAQESCLRWQFWQGPTFRCTLCNYVFTIETHEEDQLSLETESSLIVSEGKQTEKLEPLIDVFEEASAIRIYVELLNEIKNEMQLEVKKSRLEITARDFYKLIDLSAHSIEQEKAYYNYRNCVLEIVIPKREKVEVLTVVQKSF